MLAKMLGSKKRIVTAALSLLLIALAVVLLGKLRSADDSDVMLPGAASTFEVARGSLDITVNVSGTVKARELVILKSEVEGQTTILWIIEEGKRVKEGDLLVELDSSAMQDLYVEQDIRVQNSEAAFIMARESLAVAKNQAESDVDKAELALQFAGEDLDNYENGQFPIDLKAAEAKVTLSLGDEKRANEELEASSRLLEREFITRTEFEADQQAAEKARLDRELAEANRELLKEFTYKRSLTELKSDVKQAEMALERVRRKASADVIQAEADLKAKEAAYGQQKGKLEKVTEQITKTKIVAPVEGLVIYATTGRGSWRGNEEPLAEGQQVRERQELIHLPTASSFNVDAKVHESSLAKIKVGLPVRIRADALPSAEFGGIVTAISPLPDAQSMWLNPDLKVYNTEVEIDGDAQGLRTGMTCRGEILVEQYPDTVYVPVQSVVRVDGRPTVYAVGRGGVKPRPVKIGLDNNRMVKVLSGVEPGERILLAPPLASSESQGGGGSKNGNGGAKKSDGKAAGKAGGGSKPSGSKSAQGGGRQGNRGSGRRAASGG
ncbi:MAG: efflux RND transporter periplasmic adaptor subunit [bacterium]|nr:efflux RND transporter periplasmic adaptor subunit [bacterium]